MKKLLTYMNNELVGEFIKHNNGAHHFKYHPDWLANSKARVLSLSLPLQVNSITSDKVINYFDNLLPDRADIRDRIVNRYQADSNQVFDLLCKIGRDSVGAITLIEEGDVHEVKRLDYTPLSKNALEQVLLGYKTNIPLGMLTSEDDFRISIAGAQEKTALLKLNGNWCIPHGSTPTTHIIKLPIGFIEQPNSTLDMSNSVENEYLCILLAKALGFSVPNVEIIETDKVKAIAVERFDRRFAEDKSWLIRLPQEDMCQAQGKPSAIKYESHGGAGIKDIMAILMGSSRALQDRDAFMRFQVFQWLIGATDGHAKNFSLFIEQGGGYHLTPFYDIISAYPVLGGKGLNIKQLKLSMGLKASKGKKYHINKIFPRHFIDTAKEVGFSTKRMQKIMDDFVIDLPLAIAQVKTQLPNNFPEKISNSIFDESLKQLKKLSQGIS